MASDGGNVNVSWTGGLAGPVLPVLPDPGKPCPTMTSTGPGGDDVEDLVGFLTDTRLPVQQHALDILLGLTVHPEGLERLRGRAAKLLFTLLRMVCNPDRESSCKAVTALINLSQVCIILAACQPAYMASACFASLSLTLHLSQEFTLSAVIHCAFSTG